MKKTLLILLAIIALGLIYLIFEGRKTLEIKTEIDILAPPPEVWTILIDINNWHEWSPIINASQGEATVGSMLNITMMDKEEGKDGPNYYPIITELKEAQYFHWKAQMMAGFIFTNEKIFKLEETDTGTHLTHIEMFKGLMAPLMAGSVKSNVPEMLDSMNKALKNLAEK